MFLRPRARLINPGEWIIQARASSLPVLGRDDSRVEDIPEQPIKPLLMVSKNICSSSKPISRLSEAEITGTLAVQDKLANSEMQAILFYIKASENQHASRSPLSSRFDAWLPTRKCCGI